jgi:hypothetical protein
VLLGKLPGHECSPAAVTPSPFATAFLFSFELKLMINRDRGKNKAIESIIVLVSCI